MTGLRQNRGETLEYPACLDSGLVPNPNSNPCQKAVRAPNPREAVGRRGSASALPKPPPRTCGRERTRRVLGASAPPTAPTQVPAAGAGERSLQRGEPRARRAHPNCSGAPQGQAGSGRCEPPLGKPGATANLKPRQISGGKGNAGNKWEAQPPGQGRRTPKAEGTARGAGARPPRRRARPACAPGQLAGLPISRPRAAPPPPPSRHSLLHSSSAHSLCSAKRRLVSGCGWPGTRQGGPSRSSQKSSPGAAAMLWSPQGSRRRGGGGEAGRAPEGGAEGGARRAGRAAGRGGAGGRGVPGRHVSAASARGCGRPRARAPTRSPRGPPRASPAAASPVSLASPGPFAVGPPPRLILCDRGAPTRQPNTGSFPGTFSFLVQPEPAHRHPHPHSWFGASFSKLPNPSTSCHC